MSSRGRAAAAFAWAASAAGLAVAAAALVAFYPPPSTLASLYPPDNPHVSPGRFTRNICNGVQCLLCPHNCFLPEGARGKCKVRINFGGRIKTLVYSRASAVHVDPIEKKPVYHMYPGSLIYSLASPGCNLSCRGCQNWEISQIYPEQAPASVRVPTALAVKLLPDGRAYGEISSEERSSLSPEEIVRFALATRSKAVAYTYSEPAVFYEYTYDTARLARAKGLKNVMVSAGYINPEPLAELLPYMDVVKIDLKGFDPDFYRRYAGGELEAVKTTLKELKKKRVLTEVVNLVIPGLNDSEADLAALAAWVMDNLGPDTPLFFSRFSPNYLVTDIPPTPLETLERARKIAMKKGLRYVYSGNVPGSEGEATICPRCKRVLIRRYGYAVLEDHVTRGGGRCPWDGTRIPGVWEGAKQ